MSAQGATLRRGTIELPIWPVAVLVVAALAAAIGMTSFNSIDTIAPARTLVTVTDTQRLANSTAAVRQQGAVLPVVWSPSHVAPSLQTRSITRPPDTWVSPTCHRRCTLSTTRPPPTWGSPTWHRARWATRGPAEATSPTTKNRPTGLPGSAWLIERQ